jgi:hypothetical protein
VEIDLISKLYKKHEFIVDIEAADRLTTNEQRHTLTLAFSGPSGFDG